MEEKLLAIGGGKGEFADATLLGEQVVEGVATDDGHDKKEAKHHPTSHIGARDSGREGIVHALGKTHHPDGLHDKHEERQGHNKEEAQGHLHIVRTIDNEVVTCYVEKTIVVHNEGMDK